MSDPFFTECRQGGRGLPLADRDGVRPLRRPPALTRLLRPPPRALLRRAARREGRQEGGRQPHVKRRRRLCHLSATGPLPLMYSLKTQLIVLNHSQITGDLEPTIRAAMNSGSLNDQLVRTGKSCTRSMSYMGHLIWDTR